MALKNLRQKPTIIITFDAPELETSNGVNSRVRGMSVFSLLGFEGQVNWHKESLMLIFNKSVYTKGLLFNILILCYRFFLFLYYLFFVLYTKFKKTKTIFDILRENKVKATFFGIAANLNPKRESMGPLYYNPRIFKKIIENGHELGLHGYYHNELNEEDVMMSIELYKRILNTTPKTYSTPFGFDNNNIEKILKKFNFLGWRTFKFENNFKECPYKVKYSIGENQDISMSKLRENGNVLVLTFHMYVMHPLNVIRFNNKLREIRERNIQMPTFTEFCTYIEETKSGDKR